MLLALSHGLAHSCCVLGRPLHIYLCGFSRVWAGTCPNGHGHVFSGEILKFLKEIRNVFYTQVRFPEDAALQVIPVPSLNLICLRGLVWNLG